MTTDAVIRIKCPNLVCQRVLGVPAHARGKIVRCGSCRTNVRIPAPKADKPIEQVDAPEDGGS